MKTKEDLIAIIENSKEFMLWLNSKDTHAVVGYAWSSTDCPFLRFVYESGFPAPWLTYFLKFTDDNGEEVLTSIPKWVVRFAAHVDSMFPNDMAVTAGQCKRILKKIIAALEAPEVAVTGE